MVGLLKRPGNHPASQKRQSRRHGNDSKPTNRLAVDVLLCGKQLNRVCRFLVRYPSFFCVSDGGFMPIAFAKQVKHQILLDFSHAIGRMREESKY